MEYASKEDYLMEIYSQDELGKFSDIEIETLINSIDEKEFEQYLNEQELNLSSNIIRYDASKTGYKPLVHSYSHLHIGLNQHLRITCSKIKSPLYFVYFCIKNTYYAKWKNSVEKNEKFAEIIAHSKAQCSSISDEYWSDLEKSELFLY